MNSTLLDDVLSISANESTSFAKILELTNDPFPAPADPFDTGVVNITDHAVMEASNTTSSFDFQDVLGYIELNPWVIYVGLAIGILVIVLVVTCIVAWICKNKQRMINQERNDVLANTYDQDIKWEKCCFCITKKVQSVERVNSASNLESYGRQGQLPASAYKDPISITNELRIGGLADESQLASTIDGIRGVPYINVPREQMRNLPSRAKQYLQ